MNTLQDGGPNPHFEGLHHGETDDLRALRLKQADRIDALEAENAALRRIAVSAQQVTTGCRDQIDYFTVPANLMAALSLALDESRSKT